MAWGMALESTGEQAGLQARGGEGLDLGFGFFLLLDACWAASKTGC